MTDSTFERHIPCPLCGSSDAGALYSNGSMYCHKCQKPFDMDGEIPLSKTSKPMQSIQIKGDAQRLSKESSQKISVSNSNATETENFYASIITQAAEILQDAKSKTRTKNSG